MTQPANTVQSLRAALQGQVTPANPASTPPPIPDTPVPPLEPVVPAPPDLISESVAEAAPQGDLKPEEEVLPGSFDLVASPTPDTPSPPAAGDVPEKSPLEVLEEILAGAEAEKSAKDQEAEMKKQEEAEFQAQLAAKQEAFKQEAMVRLQEQHVAVEAAEQHRDEVEKQLQKQGKLDPVKTTTDDPFIIRQLEHDKA